MQRKTGKQARIQYTRAHWLEINEQLIAGALNYVNPETGIFSLPESTGAYRELEDFRKRKSGKNHGTHHGRCHHLHNGNRQR